MVLSWSTGTDLYVCSPFIAESPLTGQKSKNETRTPQPPASGSHFRGFSPDRLSRFFGRDIIVTQHQIGIPLDLRNIVLLMSAAAAAEMIGELFNACQHLAAVIDVAAEYGRRAGFLNICKITAVRLEVE
jgi:hypothetical protein